MDAAFLPRTESATTLAWLKPYLSLPNAANAIIQAIEDTGTPVFLVSNKRLNQWVWWLCSPKTGFLTCKPFRHKLAFWLLKLTHRKSGLTRNPVSGFFWYPLEAVSATVLSYDVHHWRVTLAAQQSKHDSHHWDTWQRAVRSPATLHPDALSQLDETELDALQQAVTQELDALTTLYQTLDQQTT